MKDEETCGCGERVARLEQLLRDVTSEMDRKIFAVAITAGRETLEAYRKVDRGLR